MKERKAHLRKAHNVPNKRMDYILLAVIMLVAAVLRLWKLGQVPFMHDEFSALLRTRFDNFHDFIQLGIMPDSHPIGVEAFLWLWVRLFGWSELWVKLPFVLMGIGSIFLIYLIGKQWFNRKIGLFSAAFFAVSQFTVFYSQLARPYSAGLFFVLLMAWFWYRVVFETKTPKKGVYIGFALSAWACSLMQYFSIAQAGLIFLTGLFFLPKERRKAYWISGIGAVLLFAPTLPIFYQQLFVSGSIGGWLATPKATFLVDFIQYTMNYSTLFMFVVGIVILLPLILGKRTKRRNPLRWAGIVWFVIIFVIAFAYSLFREPILQQSTLIFSFPFVIIVAFSMFGTRTLSPWQTAVVVAVILFAGTSSLIMDRKHYDTMYHQGFDQIAVEMQADREQYGNRIQFATRTEIGEAAEFYQEPLDIEERMVYNRYSSVSEFYQWLHEHDQAPMLGFGWTDYMHPIWEATAVGFYPNIVKQKDWFTSRYLTLSKAPAEGSTSALETLNEEPYPFYNGMEWGSFSIVCGDSLPDDVESIGFIADFHNNDTVTNCVVVIEIKGVERDSILLWYSSPTEEVVFAPGQNTVVNAVNFNEIETLKGTTIKAYIWNKGHCLMTQDKMSCYLTRKDPILTGLYEPLN